MNSARLHKEDVQGYGGYARIYQVEPPIFEGGLGYRFLTIVVYSSQTHKGAEVSAFYTNAAGGAARASLRRETGSFVTKGDPFEDGQHHLDGCFVMALALNGYEIEGYGAQRLPAGLDYNPDDLPDY